MWQAHGSRGSIDPWSHLRVLFTIAFMFIAWVPAVGTAHAEPDGVQLGFMTSSVSSLPFPLADPMYALGHLATQSILRLLSVALPGMIAFPFGKFAPLRCHGDQLRSPCRISH